MERRTRGWSDEHVQLIVGYFLRTGIIIASVIVFIGGVLYLIKYGADFPEYRIFSGEPAYLRSVHGIITDALSLRSRDIIQFGLLLLMFTPVAWVAFLMFAFARQRDRTYIVIAAIVLGTLLFSLAVRYFFR
jgi:uncharacterized membrane protein